MSDVILLDSESLTAKAFLDSNEIELYSDSQSAVQISPGVCISLCKSRMGTSLVRYSLRTNTLERLFDLDTVKRLIEDSEIN